MDYRTLPLETLVGLLWRKEGRNEVIRALIGGLTATELRRIRLDERRLNALVSGLEHANPRVRWWCLQLLDHLAEERCIGPMSRLLYDPVPRVRKMALHALTCDGCKNNPVCPLSPEIIEQISQLARHDENAGVREAAHLVLLNL